VDLASIVASIEGSGIGEWMRGSLKAMPIVEAIHVTAVALLFGTIFIVDLRLLGLPSTQRSFTRISDELLRLTWAAFFLAAITGALMFSANATTYFVNTAFNLKMVALLGAGVNMAVFQFITLRTVAAWDKNALPPLAARAAGALSILIWTSVIFLGRWIGFTKGYDFEIPEDVDFDFEFLEIGLRFLHRPI
jgi:hypothetical protein